LTLPPSEPPAYPTTVSSTPGILSMDSDGFQKHPIPNVASRMAWGVVVVVVTWVVVVRKFLWGRWWWEEEEEGFWWCFWDTVMWDVFLLVLNGGEGKGDDIIKALQ